MAGQTTSFYFVKRRADRKTAGNIFIGMGKVCWNGGGRTGSNPQFGPVFYRQGPPYPGRLVLELHQTGHTGCGQDIGTGLLQSLEKALTDPVGKIPVAEAEKTPGAAAELLLWFPEGQTGEGEEESAGFISDLQFPAGMTGIVKNDLE